MNFRNSIKNFQIADEGFHLMVKLRINGKTANVIVDTGASKTVFDSTAIQKFVKHKTFDENEQLSSGLGTNTMTSQSTSLKKIKIGELEIENYKTVLLDLSHVNDSYSQIGLKPVDGVLGCDILLKYNAVIDYEKKNIETEIQEDQEEKRLTKKRSRIFAGLIRLMLSQKES